MSLAAVFSSATRKIKCKRMFSGMGMILSAGIAFTLLTGFISAHFIVQSRNLTLYFTDLPASLDGLKLTQISDSHLGNFHGRRMMRRMASINNRFAPDILIFTGDLVNNFEWEATKWNPYFTLFRARSGKYAIPGNHDYGDYSLWKSPVLKQNNFEGIEKAYLECGFSLLQNKTEKCAFSGDTLTITGVGNWGHPPFSDYTDFKNACKGIPDSAFSILLTHNPSYWESIAKYDKRFSLTLAGHTHGFQWGIKLAGIGFGAPRLIFKNWRGLSAYEDRFLYVNSGFGTIGLPLRIDMPAEITLITLKKR
jgi:uncharacterized protein